LIRNHVEPHVVEVFGPEAERWASASGALAERMERVGETVFCYTSDERALLQSLSQETGLRYAHRPANLEDVFLKLTGHDLGAAA